MSLMRKHQANIKAGQVQNNEHEPKKAIYTPATAMGNLDNAQKRYQLMLASVEEDCKRISALNSIAERNTLKRDELLEKYSEYIYDYFESDLNHANEVFTQYIIWMFDVGAIEGAIELSLYAIEQDQKLPERFNRDLKTFVADEVYDWAKPLIDEDKSASPYFDQIFDLVIDGDWKVHESVQMKFQKLAGVREENQGNDKKALLHFEAAQKIDPQKAKVTTKISQITKRLEKAE